MASPAKSCSASGKKSAGIWKSPNRPTAVAALLADHLPLDRLTIHRFEPDHRRVRVVATLSRERRCQSSQATSISPTKLPKQLDRWIRRREADSSSGRAGQSREDSPQHRHERSRRRRLVARAAGRRAWLAAASCWPSRRPSDRFSRDSSTSLLAGLAEPLAVALDNDARLHEIAALREAAEADRRSLLNRFGRKDVGETIVGEDSGLRQVMQRVDMVSRSDVPVLILGETGTGKELVARAIHNRSDRHSGPFIRVNCGAIPRELIDSQLFGHEKGSFTGAADTRQGWFERADMGTLFLDEIGELPLDAQVRFLRVLQDGFVERVGSAEPIRVNVRVVAATHRDLAGMVRESTFREDLWYRIAVFPILLPPLRERVEDIPALARHFAERAAIRFGLAPVDAQRGRHPHCCRTTIGPATSASWARSSTARQSSATAARSNWPPPSASPRHADPWKRHRDERCAQRIRRDSRPSIVQTLEAAMQVPHRSRPPRHARPHRRPPRRRPTLGDQSPHAPRPHAEAEDRMVGVSRRSVQRLSRYTTAAEVRLFRYNVASATCDARCDSRNHELINQVYQSARAILLAFWRFAAAMHVVGSGALDRAGDLLYARRAALARGLAGTSRCGDLHQHACGAFSTCRMAASPLVSKMANDSGPLSRARAVAIYYFGFVTPDGNQKWSPEQARQPHVEIDGDKVHIDNVRNFTWRTRPTTRPASTIARTT